MINVSVRAGTRVLKTPNVQTVATQTAPVQLKSNSANVWISYSPIISVLSESEINFRKPSLSFQFFWMLSYWIWIIRFTSKEDSKKFSMSVKKHELEGSLKNWDGKKGKWKSTINICLYILPILKVYHKKCPKVHKMTLFYDILHPVLLLSYINIY